jgi:hypothetical protein
MTLPVLLRIYSTETPLTDEYGTKTILRGVYVQHGPLTDDRWSQEGQSLGVNLRLSVE